MSISLKLKKFKRLSLPKLNPWLLGLLVLVSVGSMSYIAYNQIVVVPKQQAKNKVQTANVERSNLTISVSANGIVQPERSVNVSPKTSGILKQLLVKEGDTVQQGQVLAYMDLKPSGAIPSGSGQSGGGSGKL